MDDMTHVEATERDGTATAARRAALSARERQILEMASLGLTNAEIAASLSVTVHAVKFHLASVYRKLGVSNRTEAAVKFLIPAPDIGRR